MKYYKLYLILLLALSFFFRLYRLSSIPEGFHADEAAFGYNTYSLLTTGKDEYGIKYPIILKSFGDFKGALYSYISIPFVALFGLNEFSVRVPTAIFGTIAVLFMYLIVYVLTKQRILALLVATLHAVNPSAVFLSRVQSDPLTAGVLLLIGLYYWLMWVKNNRLLFLAICLLFWTLACFGYITTRIFLLLLIPLLLWSQRIYRNKKQLIHTTLVYLFLVWCSVFSISGGQNDRLLQVNPFTKLDVQLPLDESIREDGIMNNRGLITRIMHNKVIAYTRSISRLAVSYLSPEFLFFQSQQPVRERVQDTGIVFVIELPFILFGLYSMFRKKTSWRLLMIMWLLMGVSSLSFASAESPNIHRFYILLLPIHVISSYGILEVIQLIKNNLRKTILIGCIAFLFSINIGVYIHQLFIHQPSHAPYFRGFAYKQLIERLSIYYPAYKRIIVTKGNESPYIYFLFFSKYSPTTYQQSGSHRDMDFVGFDKYVFVPSDCPSFNEPKSIELSLFDNDALLIRRGGCRLGVNDHMLERITWRDDMEAFQLVDWQATPAASITEIQ